jgi:small subunit ribosomal protein S11e
MEAQTEKSFQKQPTIFLASKKKFKGRRNKAGVPRYVRSVGLGFKTPASASEGVYIDHKCPFTGNVAIRGRILKGVCVSAKMQKSIIVRRDYVHFLSKYKRYEKRHKNIPAHISPCFQIAEGDVVTVGECRPLSKTIRFNVLKVEKSANSGEGAKKQFRMF